MTLEDLNAKLASTGIPVTYNTWPEKKKPSMPYICNLSQYTNNFYADGTVWAKIEHMSADLYTSKKDIGSEGLVEQALKDFAWSKSEEYNKKEQCYRITYELEV